VAFGEAITMHVEAIEYSDPSLITFYGFGANRKPMQLIQHLTQLNFLLTAVDKIPNQPNRTTIGFQLQQQLDNYLQKTLSSSTQPPAGSQA
jgi:acyl CoA:acetate/3-ketoacid CoA transferase alpha subunit